MFGVEAEAEARLTVEQRFRIAKAKSKRLLKYDDSEPRDDQGRWTSGGGGSDSDGSKPTGGGAGKKPAKKEDFDKAKITLDGNKAQQDAFIDKWNEKVGQDPAEFKSNFMGGLDGNMKVGGSGDLIEINGEVAGGGGKTVGTFTRNINLDTKSATSAYFKLDKSATKSDIGKKMLAGNVETYKRLGIESVGVMANIDVGGYAWAKYGYVPTQSAWNSLRATLERKLTGGDSSSSSRNPNSVEADEWDQLSSDVQDDVRDRWMRDTFDEFHSSEVQNYRDSGQAKDDAKREIAYQFGQYDSIPQWAGDAMDAVREERKENGDPEIPYTNKQLYDAIDLEYESNRGDGEDDPDISFDDDKLREPKDTDPNQPTLPGIEPPDLSQRLTSQMRKDITSEMRDAFNKKADDDADEMDAPSYLSDSVSEYQDEYWSSMDDSQKLQVASRFGMADIEVEPDEEEEKPQAELELPKTDTDPLLAAVQSSDPKSIWKVADSPKGKQLLLGTSWSGKLNLKDPESMARFNAYVGKASHA